MKPVSMSTPKEGSVSNGPKILLCLTGRGVESVQLIATNDGEEALAAELHRCIQPILNNRLGKRMRGVTRSLQLHGRIR